MTRVSGSYTLHSASRENIDSKIRDRGEHNIVTVGIWQEQLSSTWPPGFSLNEYHPLKWVYSRK